MLLDAFKCLNLYTKYVPKASHEQKIYKQYSTCIYIPILLCTCTCVSPSARFPLLDIHMCKEIKYICLRHVLAFGIRTVIQMQALVSFIACALDLAQYDVPQHIEGNGSEIEGSIYIQGL